MKLRIKGHEEFNRREKIREDMSKSGIHMWFPPVPKEDRNRVIIEKLDQIVLHQTKNHAPLSEKIYLDKKEVAELLGLSVKSVDNMRKKAILPEPKKLPLSDADKRSGGRTTLRWKTQEVIDWIDAY